MARGNVVSEIGARYITLTEDGTAAIVKGDLCIIRAGLVKKVTADSDTAPYCVAVEAIAKSGSGRVLIEGVVQMDEGNIGALTLGDYVIPKASTWDVQKAGTTDYSSNYVKANHTANRLIVGMVLEAIAKDGTGKILLIPNQLGLSD